MSLAESLTVTRCVYQSFRDIVNKKSCPLGLGNPFLGRRRSGALERGL